MAINDGETRCVFTARERFNWGYWDARADAERGKFPRWWRPWNACRHPCDKIYGQGYLAGRYDDSGSDSSDAAWKGR